jgi:hypothetical protein
MQSDKPTWPTETNRGALPPKERFKVGDEVRLDCLKETPVLIGHTPLNTEKGLISGHFLSDPVSLGRGSARWRREQLFFEDDLLTVSEWCAKYGGEAKEG